MQSSIKKVTFDKWKPQGIDELEKKAFDVVRSTTHQSVIAGPGAGKTELLAQRACYLLQTGLCPNPKRILAISFKKDAAKNLKNRVEERCHTDLANRFDSLTFDAFSKHLLDRFYKALPEKWKISPDYKIYFPDYKTFPGFLNSLPSPPEEIGTLAEVKGINQTYFERDHVVGAPLPINGFNPQTVEEWATSVWWEGSLYRQDESNISFPMIGRLVELLIRTNPLIRSALQSTYSHVFLDEFQDTTHVQYDLVKTIFLGSGSILTAVGDNKQQIMRWAMALPDPFGDFENDYGATRIGLERNYRSSSALVAIQHQIALAVDPHSVPSEAMSSDDIDGDACAIWDFETPKKEAVAIAQLIADGVNNDGLLPRDFAILVKQTPRTYEGSIVSALKNFGIKARVEADLQDILSENITKIMLNFLRFGALERSGAYWGKCLDIYINTYGIHPENIKANRQAEKDLSGLHDELLDATSYWPKSKNDVFKILNRILDFIGTDTIKLLFPEYQQGEWLDKTVESIAHYLFESCESHGDWQEALDDFEGKDSVPIMTIHKSKGLEYHTIIFVGLDDKAWWSFRNQPEESRSAFFVAFSRAKQRIVFTYCATRGARTQIGSLYDILEKAGVGIIEM